MDKQLSILELAKRYLAYEESDISDFQRKARILQSMWREEQGYEPGEYRGKKRGNYLPMPWAKETLSNYLSDTIKDVVRDEVINNPDDEKLYGKPRIFDNLLYFLLRDIFHVNAGNNADRFLGIFADFMSGSVSKDIIFVTESRNQ